MSTSVWRNIALALAAVCVYLIWRGPRAPATPKAQAATAPHPAQVAPRVADDLDEGDPPPTTPTPAPPDDDGEPPVNAFGFSIPGWAKWFAPQEGESLAAYRDRVLPFVEAAVAPQRARVARARDDFAAAAHLDDRQRQELDAACADASQQIEDRVMQGILSGDLMPDQVKPITAVAFARDILDDVDGANRRFEASLSDDQRAALAEHPFDVADYLLFSTRWEDMLNALMPPEAQP